MVEPPEQRAPRSAILNAQRAAEPKPGVSHPSALERPKPAKPRSQRMPRVVEFPEQRGPRSAILDAPEAR